MKYALTIVRRDYSLTLINDSRLELTSEHGWLGFARPTMNAPMRPARRFDRIEQGPRRPLTCLA